MGFFREDLADQALRCLELMEFKNKEQLVRVISQGKTQAQEIDTLRTQLLQLAQVVDETRGTHLAQTLAAAYTGCAPAAAASGGTGTRKKASAVERSRSQSREAVRPR